MTATRSTHPLRTIMTADASRIEETRGMLVDVHSEGILRGDVNQDHRNLDALGGPRMLHEELKPEPENVPTALEQYVRAVRRRYGDRLHSIVLFGSRARGDMQPDSDADVAVIIADEDWSFWREKRELADLTYEPLADWGLSIQPWPLSLAQWNRPELHHNPRFVEAIKRDARSLSEHA